ncbi:LxmA leader domain family RiPP [Streptomyces sp. JL4002]|uniref:LxmA leader domain family RiPP n=1 Tax=Streptomyces TaxID=1883 RepID=UPI003411F2ED
MDNASMMDLVAGYNTYAEASELGIQAVADAPATTPVCAATIAASAASSGWCASAAASAAGGATYKLGC